MAVSTAQRLWTDEENGQTSSFFIQLYIYIYYIIWFYCVSALMAASLLVLAWLEGR